jgi:glycosyltransferase involved in cell wall biosynthesis
VVIPVRDGAGTIGDQLAALAGQDFGGRWDIVIADNGSTDDTVAVVERWRDRLPPLRVVDASGRQGVSHARNVGVAAAGADLVAVCDADDVVERGWLSALVAASPGADLVAGPLDEVTLNAPAVRSWRTPLPTAEPAGAAWFRPFAAGANFAVWRRVVDDLGGWNEGYPVGNDVEFSWRAQRRGWRLGFAPDAVVRHRYRADLGSWARQSYRRGRASVHLYADFRRDGMAREPRRLRAWGSVVLRSPAVLRSSAHRGRWVGDAATMLGRARGAVEQRVLTL